MSNKIGRWFRRKRLMNYLSMTPYARVCNVPPVTKLPTTYQRDVINEAYGAAMNPNNPEARRIFDRSIEMIKKYFDAPEDKRYIDPVLSDLQELMIKSNHSGLELTTEGGNKKNDKTKFK